MKTILLMRHAKSSWDEQFKEDRDRPLSKRGRKNAGQIAKLLKEQKLIPGLILSSSAVRARQTANILVDMLNYQGDISFRNKLYMAEAETYVEEIQCLNDESNMILVIGHNPSLDNLLQMLTGKEETLTTASVAKLMVPIESWKEFTLSTRCELSALWRPKEL